MWNSCTSVETIIWAITMRKVIPHANFSSPRHFKLQWMSRNSCSVMLISGRSRRKLTEKTKIQIQMNLVQHTHSDNVTSMSQWQVDRKPCSWQILATECTTHLFTVKWELGKPNWRPSISLVSETGMFLWMPSPIISGCPLFSLLCWLSLSLPPLVGGGKDWCVSWLVRLICCQIILTASSPGSLLICQSLAIHLLFTFQVKLDISC